MANAGRILIIPRGDYNRNTTYEMLDLVSYNDASWLAKKTVKGIDPSDANSEYWFKMMCESTSPLPISKGGTGANTALTALANLGITDYVTPQMFGAKADGVTDDSDAIQSAINSLPSRGGTVYFPAGTYIITKQIDIGDGDHASTPSTKNAIRLIGASSARCGSNVGVEIKPSTSLTTPLDRVFHVHGRINNVSIENFSLYCDGRAKIGLCINACSQSEFKNIVIYNPTYCGLYLGGGKEVTENYCIHNLFSNISVSLATSNTIGLEMTGNVSANTSCWLTKFECCRFQSMSNTTNCISASLKFADSCTFVRCHFVTYSSTGRGVEFNSKNNANFPCGMAFYDCSIINTVVSEGTTAKIRPNYFIGFGTHDGEIIPTHEKLIGITDTGVPFNGWGTSS